MCLGNETNSVIDSETLLEPNKISLLVSLSLSLSLSSISSDEHDAFYNHVVK